MPTLPSTIRLLHPRKTPSTPKPGPRLNTSAVVALSSLLPPKNACVVVLTLIGAGTLAPGGAAVGGAHAAKT